MPEGRLRQLPEVGGVIDNDVKPFRGRLPGNPRQKRRVRLAALIDPDALPRIKPSRQADIDAHYLPFQESNPATAAKTPLFGPPARARRSPCRPRAQKPYHMAQAARRLSCPNHTAQGPTPRFAWSSFPSCPLHAFVLPDYILPPRRRQQEWGTSRVGREADR